MTTALQVAQMTVAKSPVDYVRSGKSYCQTFAGNFWETHFGRPTPNSYASAAAAYRASTIVSTDPNAAPPGAYHFFEYGTAGHVGVALGSGLMASGTGYATGAISNLGKHVYVHRVSDYAKHLRYLGWAYTNGNRERITGLTDANAPVVGANQRQVKATKTARRRTQPSTTQGSYDGNANLAANAVVTPDGYVTSQLPGGAYSGSSYWLRIGGLYSHVEGFTNETIAGLTNLGVVAPPPVPPTLYVVAFDAGDGLPPTTASIEKGKLLSEPTPPPTREGYRFTGWTLNGAPYDFSTPVTGPLQLRGTWAEIPVPKYTLTYNGDGGLPAVQTFEVEEGFGVPLPIVVRAGYSFVAWVDEHGPIDAETVALSDETFTATWEIIEPEPEPEAPGNGGTWGALVALVTTIIAALTAWLAQFGG